MRSLALVLFITLEIASGAFPADRLHRRAALHDSRSEHERAAAAAHAAALECPGRLYRGHPVMASIILFAVSDAPLT
jgi:hypothetical protein